MILDETYIGRMQSMFFHLVFITATIIRGVLYIGVSSDQCGDPLESFYFMQITKNEPFIEFMAKTTLRQSFERKSQW